MRAIRFRGSKPTVSFGAAARMICRVLMQETALSAQTRHRFKSRAMIAPLVMVFSFALSKRPARRYGFQARAVVALSRAERRMVLVNPGFHRTPSWLT